MKNTNVHAAKHGVADAKVWAAKAPKSEREKEQGIRMTVGQAKAKLAEAHAFGSDWANSFVCMPEAKYRDEIPDGAVGIVYFRTWLRDRVRAALNDHAAQRNRVGKFNTFVMDTRNTWSEAAVHHGWRRVD